MPARSSGVSTRRWASAAWSGEGPRREAIVSRNIYVDRQRSLVGHDFGPVHLANACGFRERSGDRPLDDALGHRIGGLAEEGGDGRIRVADVNDQKMDRAGHGDEKPAPCDQLRVDRRSGCRRCRILEFVRVEIVERDSSVAQPSRPGPSVAAPASYDCRHPRPRGRPRGARLQAWSGDRLTARGSQKAGRRSGCRAGRLCRRVRPLRRVGRYRECRRARPR